MIPAMLILALATEPVCVRPLASVIEVAGADYAWIRPGPVEVSHGTEIRIGWVAFAADDGLIRFGVEPATDYEITAVVGNVGERETWVYPMPVTREHRVEQAVRDLVDAWERFIENMGTFFELSFWQAWILNEQGGSDGN